MGKKQAKKHFMRVTYNEKLLLEQLREKERGIPPEFVNGHGALVAVQVKGKPTFRGGELIGFNVWATCDVFSSEYEAPMMQCAWERNVLIGAKDRLDQIYTETMDELSAREVELTGSAAETSILGSPETVEQGEAMLERAADDGRVH